MTISPAVENENLFYSSWPSPARLASPKPIRGERTRRYAPGVRTQLRRARRAGCAGATVGIASAEMIANRARRTRHGGANAS